MKGIQELISHIDLEREVVIQAHDFPDHDAVGTAYALSRLLAANRISSRLCYGGEIQSESLAEMIRILEIPITACGEAGLDDDAQIIIVDGFVGNTNIRGVPGEVVGVVDHHVPPTEPNCKYFDIRPHMGACSTILYEYYKISTTEMEPNVATGLLIGLMMDTAFMTRGVAPVDLEAFSSLFFTGDWQTGSRLLKNSLSLADLSVFREAINACIVATDFCFVPVTKECTPEVMALVADFFLGLREIHFVVVLEPEREEYRISVRSEDNSRPTDVIIKKALDGIGSGGGHVHMGGGSIPRDLFPGEEVLRKRFLRAMGKG
ncbi:MAG: exopolyphosphatase [Spirochaetes bacterium]|jgi:nanoRNase/pAp phosphatase (c-di-AMP/oligoRNAs hydrolase)|nr:exopolyphosphatase [Spirochaetota bacterium]